MVSSEKGRIEEMRERARSPGGMRTHWGVKWSGHTSEKGKRGASIACLARLDKWGLYIKRETASVST
jgi:hypothetical protein